MLGAIAGDIIGSVYEWNPIKTKKFPLFHPDCRFTDDSVLTLAVADAILNDREYGESIAEYAQKYPSAGYGGSFSKWFTMPSEQRQPYNSWGNGSAMRVSPVGFAFNDLTEVLDEAKKTAEVTHNHPEGIKGAQATALSIFLARKNETTKEIIQKEITDRFGYNLNRSVEEIRANYSFDVSCQRTVPEAIISFLESENFEDAIRNAISLGGDSDTLACITGGIAQAFYNEVPNNIARKVLAMLPEDLRKVIEEFNSLLKNDD